MFQINFLMMITLSIYQNKAEGVEMGRQREEIQELLQIVQSKIQMIQKATSFLRECNTIVVGAGAGFGRDSGLPDFRGNEGFWKNYPPYRNKFNFMQCANPNFLLEHPHLFWGFYGSRLKMYREKNPHNGFQVIKNLAKSMSEKTKLNDNLFVLTSNVDGHFTKAEYPSDRVFQVHGSIHHLQCSSCNTIKPNLFEPDVDFQAMSCRNTPNCSCGEIQRPNILMFGDWGWDSTRTSQQQAKYKQFLKNKEKESPKIAIIEIGCGSAVPTIRNMMEQLYFLSKDSKFIRINLDESQSSAKWFDSNRYVDVTLNCQQALESIQKLYQ